MIVAVDDERSIGWWQQQNNEINYLLKGRIKYKKNLAGPSDTHMY